MSIKNKFAALTILTAFNFANIEAATVDTELAIIAAEQAEDANQNSTTQESTSEPEKKSRKELREEEKRLKQEQKAAEKQRKEEMKAAEKEIREAQKKTKQEDSQRLKNSQRDSSQKNFPKIDPVTTPIEPSKEEIITFEPPQNSTPIESPITPPQNSTPIESPTTPPNNSTPIESPSTPPQNSTPIESPTTPPNNSTPIESPSTPPQNSTPIESPATPAVNLPNPIVMQANFEDLAKAVNFVPLYMPKKSGFSINSMMAIGGRTAEINYGRRWEPEVSLRIRTHKRLDGEETKDISGVNGVRWRVDMTSGTTVYIAKISENQHVAAWAVGNYTFSAQVENLSFAAFHAIVADELVDLSRHYFID